MSNFTDLTDEEKMRRRKGVRAQRPLMLVGLPTETLKPDEERELIRNGSEEARQKIIVYAMRAACSYGQKVCKGNVDGEDIFSACYDALRHAVANYKPGQKSFFVYAKTYIRGEIFKAWKAQKAVKKSFMVQMENDDTDDALLVDSNEGFDFDGVHRREQIQLLRKVIDAHLSEQERLVVELRDFGQLTFIAIRDLLGGSRQNIQQIYNRAVKKIKRRVASLQQTAQYKV